ncbi:hypothetical protein Bca4012_020978 [Brassica carinata]
MIFLVKKVQFQKPATLQAGYFTTVTLLSLQTSENNYTWRVNDTSLDSFSTKHTWEVLLQRAPVKLWAPNVWFKGAIPRHAFLMWLAQLDRLPTRARLA